MKIDTPPLHHSSHRCGGLLALLALLALAAFSVSAFAQGTPSPRLIPFQGRLTNQTGIAYDNGQYTITFNLYSLAIGGSTVWTERHEKVSVIGGMVNLFLGSVNTIDTVDFSSTKYLGITVDADNNPATADPEMVPRTMIVTSFHAKNSERLQGFNWTDVFSNGNPTTGVIPASKIEDAIIPPGTLIPYAGTSPPPGWLYCYGQSLSRTDYQRLFLAIGTTYGSQDGNSFNVPDMRGRLPAGRDNMGGTGANRLTSSGSGIDGATIGSFGGSQSVLLTAAQSGLPAHAHSITDNGHSHTSRVSLNDGGAGSVWASGRNFLQQTASIYRAGPETNALANETTTSFTGINGTNASTPVNASSPHSVTQPTIILNYLIKF